MIALYSRVSTQEQATEGYSIGEQQDRLRAFAASFGWKDVKLYTDPGFSGASLDRPAMQELIRDVKAGKVCRVIVYKLDRLSRSQKDTLYLIEDVFLANKCEFISMSESFSTETPVGRATIGLLAVFAQLERETIRERMQIGRTARAKAGYFHGSAQIPPGYDYIEGRLVVNEFEAAQVRELFRLYLSGKSVSEIVDIFASRGYRVKGDFWSLWRVRAAVKNPTYIGKVTFGGVVYDGSHEPIIDEETFAESCRLVERRLARYKARRESMPKSDLLLSGICYCKRCGARMVSRAARSPSTGELFHYYVCSTMRDKRVKRATGIISCGAPAIRREKLEGVILGEIRKLSLDPSFLSEEPKEQKGPDESEGVRKEIAKINGQISRLLDLYSTGAFEVDDLSAKTDVLRETRRRLEARLDFLEAEKSSEEREAARLAVRSFSDAVDRADVDQLRVIIRALIDKIEYADDDLVIYWRFN